MVSSGRGWGRCYFDQNEKLRFENALHWLTHAAIDWAFTAGTYTTYGPSYACDDIATQIVVEWSSRFIDKLAVVYTLEELKQVRPGETITIEAKFNYPVHALAALTADDSVCLSAGGQDMASYVTITLPESLEFAQRCTVTISNTHTVLPALIPFLQIRGAPLMGGPTEQVTVDAAAPAIAFTRTRSARGNPYLQTYPQAKALADFLLARFQQLLTTWVLRDAPGVPQLELGDHVSFVDSERITGTLDGYVTGITWRFSSTVGFKQDVALVESTGLFPRDDYFIVGVTALGAAGASWY